MFPSWQKVSSSTRYLRIFILLFFLDGQSKGFGFVTFEKLDDAQKAIQTMNGQKMLGNSHWFFSIEIEKISFLKVDQWPSIGLYQKMSMKKCIRKKVRQKVQYSNEFFFVL